MPTLAMPIIEVLLVRWMAFPESGLQNHWILNGIYLLESVPGFILEYQY